MKKLLSLLLALCMVFALCACGQQGEKDPSNGSEETTYNWRIAIAETEDSSSAKWNLHFAEVLHELNPNINLQVFFSGQLGDITDCIEMCMNGQLEFVDAGPQNASNYVPEVSVFNLHFFWPGDEDVINKVLMEDENVFNAVAELYAPKNLKLLAMHSLGFLQWTSNDPIEKIEDMKGMKFRVMQSEILMNTYQSYGANPTPIPYMETYSALQLGTVEAEENQASCILDMKFHEVQKYLTRSNHAIMPGFICINNDFFNSLPEDIQNTIMEAIEKTQKWFVDEKIDHDMQEAKMQAIFDDPNSDIQEVTLTAENRAPFEEAAKSVVDFYLSEYGGDKGAALVDTLKTAIADAQA